MTSLWVLLVGVAATASVAAASVALTRQARYRIATATALLAAAVGGLLYGPDHPAFTSVLVCLLGIGAGNLLGLLLGQPASVASFALTAAVVDVYSVWRGPTAALVEAARDRPELGRWLSVLVPTAERVVGVVGTGDLAIAAALAAGLYQVGVPARIAVGAPTLALAVAIIAGLLLGGLPGIPFLAAATLLALRVRRSDRAL